VSSSENDFKSSANRRLRSHGAFDFPHVCDLVSDRRDLAQSRLQPLPWFGRGAVRALPRRGSPSSTPAWDVGTATNADIHARLFDVSGTPISSDFVVNSYTTGLSYVPEVGMSNGGSFVVVWEAYRNFFSSERPREAL
jgi:hypothetical protein